MTRILALLSTVAVLSAFAILPPIENASAGVPYSLQFPRAKNRLVVPIYCSDDSRAACYKVRTGCVREEYVSHRSMIHCQKEYQACLGRCGGDPRGPGHGD